MNKPELPPILNTKEYTSLVEKYNQEEERQSKIRAEEIKKRMERFEELELEREEKRRELEDENVYYEDKLSPCGEYNRLCKHCEEARKAISVNVFLKHIYKVTSD